MEKFFRSARVYNASRTDNQSPSVQLADCVLDFLPDSVFRTVLQRIDFVNPTN